MSTKCRVSVCLKAQKVKPVRATSGLTRHGRETKPNDKCGASYQYRRCVHTVAIIAFSFPHSGLASVQDYAIHDFNQYAALICLELRLKWRESEFSSISSTDTVYSGACR